MRVIEVRVERSNFAQTLSDMREWIDRNRADPVHFESTGDGDGSILVRLEFSRAELGVAFRRHWPAPAVEVAAAA